ncbi:hypothetical protein ACFOSB_19835 [Deinococcus rufus]|uniref:Copper amine oxidase-like N-terminal domain-containing protein n=2 Tax=Deinococcaceae TaxID=183710 RepID=A0ABV7ZG55_9DEIO
MTSRGRPLLPSILACVLAGGAVLAAPSAYRLVVNGKATTAQAIVVNGQTYVPLSALTAAGVQAKTEATTLSLTLPGSVAGGSNGVAAVAGCMNQTLFNGVWRFRVLSVTPVATTFVNKPGWEVTAELRNGTAQALALGDTGFLANNLSLAFSDATTLPFGDWSPNRAQWDHNKTIPPGAAYSVKGQFEATPETAGKAPTKVLYIRAGNVRSGLPWSAPDPAFRVDLGCRK